MKKIIHFTLLFTTFIIGTSAYIKSSGGIVNHSASPGESGCSCHGGGAGITSVSISALPAFISNQFIPSQTYTIDITVINNSFNLFGFDAEILNVSNTNAGNMTLALPGVQLVNTVRKNATQTGPKSGAGAASFQFVWVAPSSGNVTIYAAGNAINGTGGTGGDTPSASNLALTPDLTAGVKEKISSDFSGINVFPNPIISDFKIQYNLLEEGNVKVLLVDIHGKEIAEIANEKQSNGYHLLNASIPSDISKGVYFVKLSLNDKPSSQRLIITQ